MKPAKLLLLTLASLWTLGALAQYQWVDKEGRKVFSDRPPPIDVPQKNILKEPRALQPARTVTLTPATAPAGDGSNTTAAAPVEGGAAPVAPKAASKDKALEEQKAKAEADEAAKKKADEDAKAAQLAKARADNCARARQSAAALQPGRLVSTTSASGERGYMDDATRANELKRAEQIIQSDCR